MASGRNIAAPKVGDHIDGRQFGEPGRRIQLNAVTRLRPMPNRLAVRTNRTYGTARDSGSLQHVIDAGRIKTRQVVRCSTRPLDLVRARGAKVTEHRPELATEGTVSMRQRRWRCYRAVGEHGVNAVQTGTRHQADEQRRVVGRRGHRC